MTKKVYYKEVPCNQIVVGERFRKEMGDLKALADSMREPFGVIHPPSVRLTKNGTLELTVGERRLRAARDIRKEETIWVRVEEGDEVQDEMYKLELEHIENEHRLQPNLAERLELLKAIEDESTSQQGARTDLKPKNNNVQLQARGPEVKPGEQTRDVNAKRAGFQSSTEARRVKTVMSQGTPELQAAMVEEVISISKAAKLALEPKKVQLEAVAAARAPKPKVGGKKGKGNKPTGREQVKEKGEFDGLPKSVQSAMADIWHADMAHTLNKIRTQCKSAFTWSTWLSAAVLDHLKAAEECFTTAIPRKICPDCKGMKDINKKPCHRCRGGGYLASQQ